MFELVSCQQVGSRFHVVEWASPVWRCHDSFRIEQGKRVEPKRFGQAKMAKQGCDGDTIDAQSKIIGIAVERHGRPYWMVDVRACVPGMLDRSEEHTSALQSLMRMSYAVFCLQKKNRNTYSRCKRDNTQ